MTADEKVLVVAGRRLRTEGRDLPIDELLYYTENPRIFTLLEGLGNQPSQEQIEGELWKLDPTKDLFQDIKSNKGLMEEVIVSNGIVLEGNTRLCVYRKLESQAKTDEERAQWHRIPAKVILDDISKEEIFTLLGTFHIRGKAKWRTFEQAGYVYRMKHELRKTPDQIADMIGLSKNEINSMIKAYELMRKEGIADQEKFSHFFEYAKRPGFTKLRKTDRSLDKTVAEIIKTDRVPRAEKVRDLEAILEDKKARKAFVDDKEDFDVALAIAHRRHPERADSFYKKMEEMRELLRTAPIPELTDEMKNDSTRRSKVQYFIKEVWRFAKLVGFEGNRWRGNR
jgi:hypothetical protein